MPGVSCSCGLTFEAEPGDAVCTACGAVHLVPAETRRLLACGCGRRLAVPSSLGGKAVKCPSCGAVLRVPLPGAPAARPAAAEVESPRWRRWILALALLPLILSLFQRDDDGVGERLQRMAQADPDIVKRIEAARPETPDDLCRLLPGERIEGALHSRFTWFHWIYALISALVFWLFILLVYPTGNATSRQLWSVGLFTGTVGILLLLALQWLALHSGGVWLRGGSIVVVLFYIVKFIGFSYAAALGDTNFVLSMIGFTFGVGLCEEVCKAMPLLWHYRKAATLDLRGAVVWGLASGIGFGVSEGITYASDYYNGISSGGIYLVRFVSCVALHAVWNAFSAVLLWQRQTEIQDIEAWHDWFLPLLKILGLSMFLHALYDTALKKEMEVLALLTAVVSFVLFFWIYEKAAREAPATA